MNNYIPHYHKFVIVGNHYFFVTDLCTMGVHVLYMYMVCVCVGVVHVHVGMLRNLCLESLLVYPEQDDEIDGPVSSLLRLDPRLALLRKRLQSKRELMRQLQKMLNSFSGDTECRKTSYLINVL